MPFPVQSTCVRHAGLLLTFLVGCDQLFGLRSVEVTPDSSGGIDPLLESGLPASAVVQVVANTSFCAFNQGIFVCPGRNDSHTCALRNDRTVWCWGSDRWGRLGFVPTDEMFERLGAPVFVPRRVDPLANKPVTAIAAGADHTCALLEDGQVYCWGYNWNGQLGISAGTETATDGTAGKGQPPAVLPLYTISGPALVASNIEAGQGASCARDSTGSVVCAGKADDQDVAAFNAMSITTISMGWKTSCGLSVSGALFCSGDNAYGQVLAGGPAQQGQTLMIDNGVTDVRVGYGHVCARSASDTSCWGNGAAFGGSGSVAFANRQKIGTGTAGGAPVTRFEAGGSNTCWVEQGQARCAGAGGAVPAGLLSHSSGPLTNVRDIALSQTHACALTTGGELYCVGSNTDGQLGRDPLVTPSSVTLLPVSIPD